MSPYDLLFQVAALLTDNSKVDYGCSCCTFDNSREAWDKRRDELLAECITQLTPFQRQQLQDRTVLT